MCFSAAIFVGVTDIIFGLQSPADGGLGRIKMVDKPHTVMPVVLGGVLEHESRHLFKRWKLANQPGARHWDFVTQLLILSNMGQKSEG